MRAAVRNLSPPKLNAQKKKIWDVRPGVRKIKAIVEKLWESAEKTKTIGKSYVHKILKKSWIKISKPWDNPFAERGIRTIKREYVNQVWVWNFSKFEKLSEVIKPHYNECRPHQSFDNKTPAEVRIAVTGDKR